MAGRAPSQLSLAGVLMVIAAVVVTVGVFQPWASIDTLRGVLEFRGTVSVFPGSWGAFGCGVLGGLAGLVATFAGARIAGARIAGAGIAGVVGVVAFLAALGICLYNVLVSPAFSLGIPFNPGWGLWMSGTGSLLGVLVSLPLTFHTVDPVPTPAPGVAPRTPVTRMSMWSASAGARQQGPSLSPASAPVPAPARGAAPVQRPPTWSSAGASVAPAWLPDPSGRHRYRYFDGSRWSGWTSEGGDAVWSGDVGP